MLDLDDVVETIGGFVATGPDHFRQAQVVYAELVGAWLRKEFDVIAHGPLFERRVDEALRDVVPDGIQTRRVQLLATYEAALERVGDDPSRTLSKDPQLLRLAYERFEALLPTMAPIEWTFDTTTMSSQEVADALAAALLCGRR